MANVPENPHPTRPSDSKVKLVDAESADPSTLSDLQPERKKTMRDFLNAQTTGDPNPRTANNFPISNTGTVEISNGGFPDSGTPAASAFLGDDPKNDAFFTLENEAKGVFNSISDGSFFNDGPSQTRQLAAASHPSMEGDENFKNSQKFGHVIGSSEVTKTVAEQVSSVLLNNRFSLPEEEGEAGDYKFRMTPSPEAAGVAATANPPLATATNHSEFNTANETFDAIYFGKTEGQTESLRKVGAEAVLAGSGFAGKNPQTDSQGAGFWFDTFTGFDLPELITAVKAGEYGLNAVQQDLRDGTVMAGDSATVPSPEWLLRGGGEVPDIKLTFVDGNGQPSDENGIGTEEAMAYTVMNNMISKFISEEPLFGSKQYLNALTLQAALAVQGLLFAAIFDAVLLGEYIPGAFNQNEQYRNLRSQYEPDPKARLAKGKARGKSIPNSEFRSSDGDGALDIMNLFGVPDIDDLLSGPFFVDFILNFMGVDKPIQTKTNLTIKGFKLGDFISFIPTVVIGILQTTISALKDPLSQGFWFNLGRNIARGAALSAPAPESEGGGLAGLINFFMRLRAQPNFRYFVTMVNLGDNAVGQFFAGIEFKQANDKMFTESRMAWAPKDGIGKVMNPASVRATSSIFLIPKSFSRFRERTLQAAPGNKFGSGLVVRNGAPADSVEFGDQFYNMKEDGGRIPDEVVDKLEAALEGDYMPFYIKDLRTNEIISFHAFLDSFSDGFSSTYSKTTGLGRIEPTMTYETAQRSIGIGFTMIAFSEEDMDMLYWKLNKLVTLMYPQFSKGTQMETLDKKKFYQPFSQIPTASPMVRIRIGDILTSNFSMASSARLMGVGDSVVDSDENPLLKAAEAEPSTDPFAAAAAAVGGAGLGDTPTTIYSEMDALGKELFLKSITDPQDSATVAGVLLGLTSPGTGIKIGDTIFAPNINTKKRTGKVVIPAIEAINVPATIKKTHGLGIPNKLEVHNDGFKVIGFDKEKIELEDPNDPDNPIQSIRPYVWVVAHEFEEATTSSSGRRIATIEKCFKRTKNSPDGVCLKLPIEEITGVKSAAKLDETSLKFIAENTTTKAFENTRGEGLAGFIDNFQIDWQLNNIMWDIEPGRRAPTGCKITLGFQPVHDITPGLDADGFNRAPVYKVGSHSRNVHKPGALKPTNETSVRAFDEIKKA